MDLVFLGAPPTEKHENMALLDVIQRTVNEKAAPRSGSVQRLETVGTDSVYVYSEAAGISLPSLRLIDKYLTEAYLSPHRRESVHLDFHEERFPQEIVLREFQDVRNYLRVFRLLLLGTVTGVLSSRRGWTGRLSWSFMDLERRPPQPVELGPELFALNTLLHQQDLARRVESTINDAIRTLPLPRLIDLYAVLLANLAADGSFPTRWRYSGKRSQEVSSHGRHILDDEAERLEGLARSLGMERDQLRQKAEGRDVRAISHTVPWQEPPLRVLNSSILEGRRQGAAEVREDSGRPPEEEARARRQRAR